MSQKDLKNSGRRTNKKRSDSFRHSKSLVQNFLKDDSVIAQIVEGSGITENDLVIEVGPGEGALTEAAADAAGKLIAIELDKRLIPVLRAKFGTRDDIIIINEDILKTDLNQLISQNQMTGEGAGVRIIGNLPYYITTPIIMKILEEGVRADSITAMMQKEVADRIVAPAGSRTYGALSAAVQYYCRVTKIRDVPRHVFTPQPKVDSAVIRMDIRKEKPVTVRDERVFFQCIKAGFGQRRKTLLNSLCGMQGLEKEDAGRALDEAGIERNRRAETLTIDEFAKLSDIIGRMQTEERDS